MTVDSQIIYMISLVVWKRLIKCIKELKNRLQYKWSIFHVEYDYGVFSSNYTSLLGTRQSEILINAILYMQKPVNMKWSRTNLNPISRSSEPMIDKREKNKKRGGSRASWQATRTRHDATGRTNPMSRSCEIRTGCDESHSMWIRDYSGCESRKAGRPPKGANSNNGWSGVKRSNRVLW